MSSPEYDRRESGLRRFARQYGLAFQMADDYLDGDLEDRHAALLEVDRAREFAESLGGGPNELSDPADYLYAKVTEHESSVADSAGLPARFACRLAATTSSRWKSAIS